jgi:hypothetical protein
MAEAPDEETQKQIRLELRNYIANLKPYTKDGQYIPELAEILRPRDKFHEKYIQQHKIDCQRTVAQMQALRQGTLVTFPSNWNQLQCLESVALMSQQEEIHEIKVSSTFIDDDGTNGWVDEKGERIDLTITSKVKFNDPRFKPTAVAAAGEEDAKRKAKKQDK